jgi:hypothetical protein
VGDDAGVFLGAVGCVRGGFAAFDWSVEAGEASAFQPRDGGAGADAFPAGVFFFLNPDTTMNARSLNQLSALIACVAMIGAALFSPTLWLAALCALAAAVLFFLVLSNA